MKIAFFQVIVVIQQLGEYCKNSNMKRSLILQSAHFLFLSKEQNSTVVVVVGLGSIVLSFYSAFPFPLYKGNTIYNLVAQIFHNDPLNKSPSSPIIEDIFRI